MSIIDNKKTDIGTFLFSNKLFVPDYQRAYSWDKDENINEFFEDVIHVLEDDAKSHFFGQIVLHIDNEEDKLFIIDGQQRITTCVIFLSAIRSKFIENNMIKASQNKAEDIIRNYIGLYDEFENELKLQLGKQDLDFFKKYIQQEDHSVEAVYKSHNYIKEAYNYFLGKLNELTENLDPEMKHQKLHEIMEIVTKKLLIITVTTDELEEAFIIFETLNHRGKILETSDLLKNFLLRKAGTYIDEIKNYWDNTIDELNGSDITQYLRHFWNSFNNFTREKRLFYEIKKEITTTPKSKKFAERFSQYATVYKSVINPSDNNYFTNDLIIQKLLNLRHIGAKTFIPIILAMAEKDYNENDIKIILINIESLFVRNCVVAGYVANKYEIELAKIARTISLKSFKDTESISRDIKNLIIDDDIFEATFENLTLSVDRSKFLLREINDHYEKEVNIKKSNYLIHLEHIMPQSIENKDEWIIKKEDHKKYLNYIGNLTLLGEEFNRKLQNKGFKEKKLKYKESKISITKDIVDYSNWGIKDILNRQKKLCLLAKEVWPK